MSVGNNQPSPDEIPEALRDITPVQKKKRNRLWLWLVAGVGCGFGAVMIGVYLWNQNSDASVASAPEKTLEEPIAKPPENQSSSEFVDNSQPQESVLEQETAAMATSNDLLGHLPYAEADPKSLTPLTADGRIKLKTPAAKKFVKMQAAARREGILLVPLSGFRSVTEQEYLFFEIKAQRGQVASERAEVSAPPGYSEHHTGYAIDIGDGNAPETHVEETFGETRAFKWLQENAARYSFELSFPKDNSQKISYEPWHWRYVGNQESLEIFYKNR